MITTGKGNLLLAPVDALVNTVNTEGVMGKGIALQFREAYDEMYEKYVADCKARRVQLGKMNVFDRGALVADGPRYIINFPTKGHWRSKSRLADIEAGLSDLARVVGELTIRSIAVPPLGCGNGGLKWSDVYPLIQSTFSELPEVEAIVYAPTGAPPAAEMPRRTAKPRMSETRATLILLIDRYLKGLLDPFLTLLEVHKLMYFMQEAGQPLKLDFEAGKYGPYARNLRFELLRMEGHYLTGFGDGVESPDKQLELLPNAVDAAYDYLSPRDDVNKRLDRVVHLIDGFEDSYGMELLGTVHWVMTHNPKAREFPGVAIQEVQNWSARKQRLMKAGHLEKAWERLAKEDWNLNSASIDRLSVVD